MAFDRQQAQTPISIGSLEVTLYRADPDNPNDRSAVNYRVIVKFDGGGGSRERAGNLVPHLTAQEITQLQAFMDSLYTRAVSAILPIP